MATDRPSDIRQAALALFSARGYQATSMRDIAEAVGIQPASLYAHIRGKEDLLMAVIEDAADAFEHRGRTALLEPDEPVLVRLRKFLRAHIELITENLPAATIYLHEWRSLDVERHAQVLEKRDRYEHHLHDLLEEGVVTGELRAIDIHLTATAIFSLANGVYQWYRPSGSLDAAAIADRYFDLLVGGIASEPAAVAVQTGEAR